MAENSKIEWTTHTANLWHGCTKVHEGCEHCYAETLSKRWGHDIWGNDKPRLEVKSVWKELERFQKIANEAGEVHRVFVGSMMDIFEKDMPIINSKGVKQWHSTADLRMMLLMDIDVGKFENLMFLFLTKRPSNINKFLPASWWASPPANIMFGTSISMQNQMNLIEQLSNVNGKRFLSVEPQLEAITIPKKHLERIDWIIQGGESGPGKRPFKLDWAYSMKKDCEEAGVPFFFKQIDKVQPIPEDLKIRQFPK